MENSNRETKFKVFICFDQADLPIAKDVQNYITRNFAFIDCHLDKYYQPNDRIEKSQITQIIRSCKIFIILLSENALTENGNLKSHLGWKHVEAQNFSSQISRVYLYLAEKNSFSTVLLSMINNKKHQIQFNKGNSKQGYESIFETLCEIGCTPYDGISDDLENSWENSVLENDYDVFISYKSEDYSWAKSVRDFLVSNNLSVFLSNESLPQLGNSQYHAQIDKAIESANNMVVVTTSKTNVCSKWVEYEWRLFLGEILAGRKRGNIVSVIADKMTLEELPISLRNHEIIRFPVEMKKLIGFVRSKH